MRRLIVAVIFATAGALAVTAAAPAQGVGPAQLARAGWSCFLPPAFNPNVHCAPPGQLEGIVSGDGRGWGAGGEGGGVRDRRADGRGRCVAWHREADPRRPLPRPARPDRSEPDRPAYLRVELALPAVRLGLLHLPHLRQSMVTLGVDPNDPVGPPPDRI